MIALFIYWAIGLIIMLKAMKTLITRFKPDWDTTAWYETRTNILDGLMGVGRFIGAYLTTMITFGIPIYICWDWYVGGPEKWIDYCIQFWELWSQHTAIMLVLLLLFLIFGIIIYILLYRIAFPDYIRVITDFETDPGKFPARKVPNYEGRIYWIKGYGLSAMFSRWAGHKLIDKEIRPIKIYYNMTGPLNIFVPTKSMTTQEGLTAAQVERDGPWKIRIYEHGRSITLDNKRLLTVDGDMEQIDINGKKSNLYLQNSINQHYKDVRSASQADVELAKHQMLHSTYTIPEEIKADFPDYKEEEINAKG